MGIALGDVLISLDGVRITDMESLTSLLYSYEVGDWAEAVIYRGGQQYTVVLTIQESKG